MSNDFIGFKCFDTFGASIPTGNQVGLKPGEVLRSERAAFSREAWKPASDSVELQLGK